MEHLLLKSKCSIFHNIFKYLIFQRHQKALLWNKELTYCINFFTIHVMGAQWHSGRVLDLRPTGAAGLSLTGVTALCP